MPELVRRRGARFAAVDRAWDGFGMWRVHATSLHLFHLELNARARLRCFAFQVLPAPGGKSLMNGGAGHAGEEHHRCARILWGPAVGTEGNCRCCCCSRRGLQPCRAWVGCGWVGRVSFGLPGAGSAVALCLGTVWFMPRGGALCSIVQASEHSCAPLRRRLTNRAVPVRGTVAAVLDGQGLPSLIDVCVVLKLGAMQGPLVGCGDVPTAAVLRLGGETSPGCVPRPCVSGVCVCVCVCVLVPPSRRRLPLEPSSSKVVSIAHQR